MSLFSTVILIALLIIMISIQLIFINKLLIKSNKERMSLITLHREHVKIVAEQRDLYRELLDTIIEKHVIYNKDGDTIVNWCPKCQDMTLITDSSGEIICSKCGESPKEIKL